MTTGRKTEVRIALALNGGVSLAVWMSGVVQELDLICRASQGLPAPQGATPQEKLHYEEWQRITEAERVTLAVDIVAGTSAGGLNGTLLATALAYGAPLPDLKALWNESAAIAPEKLLWPMGDEPLPSVLNGKFFADTVAMVLQEITDGATETSASVTLFVTATAVGQADTTYADSVGTEFQVADHRRLYRFRSAPHYSYDPDTDNFTLEQENEFLDGLSELGVAARASAGFPVAFAPIRETEALANRIHPKPSNPPSAVPTYLVDGGILDNAPIEPIIDEIATRPVDGDIRRKLVYVVPSSGVVPRLPPDDGAPSPTWLHVVSSAIDFPREADFRNDIERVRTHLQDARDRQAAASELFSLALLSIDTLEQLSGAASSLLAQYRYARVIGSLRAVRAEILAWQGGPTVLASEDEADALVSPVAGALWAPAADGPMLPSGNPWTCGFSGALRTVQVLIRHCSNQISAGAGQDQFIALAEDLSEIREEIRALYEFTIDQMYEASATALNDYTAELSDTALIGIIDGVFANLQVPTTLATLVGDATNSYAEQFNVDPATTLQALIAAEIVTGALASRSEEQTPPSFDFVRLGPDANSVVIPQAAELGERKLYGTRLAHFGAFGRAEWRDWDWTWGRLDATTGLARMLQVPPEQIGTLESQVIAAEGRNVGQMTEKLIELQESNMQILLRLRRSLEGQTALRGVLRSSLRFLSQTDPRIPNAVPKAARYLRVALEQQAPSPLRWIERLVRLVAWRRRRKLWKWMESA